MDFLYGTLDRASRNLAPPEAWREFGPEAYPVSWCKREVVGQNPFGVRWAFGPLCYEEYVSDQEPDLEVSGMGYLARNRSVRWKRISRTDVPNGWRVVNPNKPWRIDGYHQLQPHGDYSEHWDKDTRRNVRSWRNELLNKHYIVEEISFGEFSTAYQTSTTFKKIGIEQFASLERKYALPHVRPHITLFGIRELASNKIIAGTAVFYFADHKVSVRECPFIHSEARKSRAMTGLIDYWFAWAQRKGVQVLWFTHFWNQGEPKAWQGFSEFKSHFNLHYVAYPPLLQRFVRGRVI